MKTKEVPVTPEARVLTGTMVPAVAPSMRTMVTGPVALTQLRVKGVPSSMSNARLVKAGFAKTVAARAPTMAAMENFILNVILSDGGDWDGQKGCWNARLLTTKVVSGDWNGQGSKLVGKIVEKNY